MVLICLTRGRYNIDLNQNTKLAKIRKKYEKNAPRQIEQQDLRNVTACFAFVGRLGKPIETEKLSTPSIRVGGISPVLKIAVFFESGFRAAALPWKC